MSNTKPSTKVVEIHGQQVWTTSLIVAEQCELSHKYVISLVRKYQSEFKEFNPLRFENAMGTENSATPAANSARSNQGRPTEIAILSEDQATYLITLFRNSPIVRRFKLKLVKAFRKALDEISRLYANPPRADLLAAKRHANRPMMDALFEARAELGKETGTKQIWSETFLCNAMVTGKFAKIDETTLSNEDAALLEKIRDRNRSYLVSGLEYAVRKAKLTAFAIRERTKRLSHEPQGESA